MPQPYNYVGSTIYGFKITGDQTTADGHQDLFFNDDMGTLWSVSRDGAEPSFGHLAFYDEAAGDFHEVGEGTDYPDKEPLGFISQAQEKPPDPVVVDEVVPHSPDEHIGTGLQGAQARIDALGTHPLDTTRPITHIGHVLPTAEEIQAEQQAEELERYEQAQGGPQEPSVPAPQDGGVTPPTAARRSPMRAAASSRSPAARRSCPMATPPAFPASTATVPTWTPTGSPTRWASTPTCSRTATRTRRLPRAIGAA